MTRACISVLLCALVFSSGIANADPQKAKRRAPPAEDGHKHKHKHKHKNDDDAPDKARRRAPPAADEKMPVRQPAALHGFNPDLGAPGTIVALRGAHFDPTVKVRFNGQAIMIVSQSEHELQVRIPQNGVSDRFVVSKAGFADITSDKTFAVVRPAQLAGFQPKQGAPGTEVTLHGKNFLPGDQLVLGDVMVPTVAIQPRRIIARIPAGAADNRFGVRRGGRVEAWSRQVFDVRLPPTIASFAPQSGQRGTLVRISGQNFEPQDFVTLSGQRVAIRGRGQNHLDVVVGNQPSGRFAVHGQGRRHSESAAVFTVVRPLLVQRFAPSYGPPGTRLTIEGSGFMPGDQALIGEAMLTVRSVSESTLVAEVPAGVASGRISVQRERQRAYARGQFEVLFAPVVSGISPLSGPPGTRVTLSGSYLLPGVSVLLAGQKLPIVQHKLPESLMVVVPPTATTGPLVVVTRAGTSQSPQNFTVTRYADLRFFFPLHGLPGSKVTLRGEHFHDGMRLFLANAPLRIFERDERQVVVEIPRNAASGRFLLESYGRKVQSRLPFKVDQPEPELDFTFAPPVARRGSEVTLSLNPPRTDVTVFFEGRPLPKKTLQGGRVIVVTVPSDARSGHFELEFRGRRYRAPRPLTVR